MRSKTLTNCAPWNRSRGFGKVRSEMPTKAAVLSDSDQITVWRSGSISLIPKRARGRSQSRPQGPSAITCRGITASPKAGRKSVQAQTAAPSARPVPAPRAVPPRQKMPPSIAGRICATPAKAMSPIADSAVPVPVRRK